MKLSSTISAVSRRFEALCLIFHLTKQRYRENHHIDRAAALTFYTLFGIVPVGALIFGVVKGFGLESSFYYLLIERSSRLRGVFSFISSYAARTLSEVSGGVVASIGLLALFFTTIFLVVHIERAFNTIWGLHRKRNLWRKLSDYAALLLFTPLALMLISSVDYQLNRMMLTLDCGNSVMDSIIYAVTWFFVETAPTILCCLSFSVIYRFAPNSRDIRFKSALISGFIAGIGFVLLKAAIFSLQSYAFTYNKIYGGFAAIPLTLLWMHWSWGFILFCGELGFVCQNTRSGIFVGRELRKLTPKQRCEHQLLITCEIYRRFSDTTAGPISEKELFQRIPLPETVLRRELYELLRCGIILRSNENEYNNLLLPGVSPEKFTLLDFFKRLYGSGEELIKEFAMCEKYFSDIENIFAACDKNIPVRDIDIMSNKSKEPCPNE